MTGSDTRARAAFDARFDPIALAVEQLFSHETESMRWLRENAPAIERMRAERLAEEATSKRPIGGVGEMQNG